MLGRLPALIALGAVLSSRDASAAADAPAVPAGGLPIALDVDPCVGIARARIAELLALELRVLAESGGPSPPGLTHARVACAGAAVTLTVSVDDAAPAADRQLDWTAYPPQGRPRLLALSLSEMIVRAWARASAAPTRDAPSVNAPPAPPTAAPPPEPRRMHLAVLLGIERIGRPRVTGAGADVVLGWRARPWLIAEVGARADGASFDTPPGAVSLRALSISVAGLAGGALGRVWLGAGPGIRAGWARLRGEAGAADPAGQTRVTPNTLAAAWWGPFARGLLAIQLGRRVLAMAAVEGGYVIRPVVGDVGPTATGDSVALDHAWATATAGVAWRF